LRNKYLENLPLKALKKESMVRHVVPTLAVCAMPFVRASTFVGEPENADVDKHLYFL